VPRREDLFEVIAEEEEFLVINKAAGLVCHPTKGDEYSSLISRARLYLGAKEEPHLINRLDRETSGIVIVAKSSAMSAMLRKVWESRAVEKEYLAIVHGELRGVVTIEAPLGADEESAVSIKDRVREDGASAKTQAAGLKTFERDGKVFSLVKVALFTGRKHQIRIHLSHIGHPIVGDKLYGGDENLYLAFVKNELADEQRERLITANQCLHAAYVSFELLGVRRSYYAPPEDWFLEFVQGKGPMSGPC
jgi:23S rRNA pseudouridine1911/1915/1917 synthase